MCSHFQLYRHSTNYKYSVILLKAFNHNEGPKKQVVNSISRRPSKRLKEKHSSLYPLEPVIKCYTSQLKNKAILPFGHNCEKNICLGQMADFPVSRYIHVSIITCKSKVPERVDCFDTWRLTHSLPTGNCALVERYNNKDVFTRRKVTLAPAHSYYFIQHIFKAGNLT